MQSLAPQASAEPTVELSQDGLVALALGSKARCSPLACRPPPAACRPHEPQIFIQLSGSKGQQQFVPITYDGAAEE